MRGCGAPVHTRPISRMPAFLGRLRLGGQQPLLRPAQAVGHFRLAAGERIRVNPPAAIAVWLMMLYSSGGRLRPLPSQLPSGICRAMQPVRHHRGHRVERMSRGREAELRVADRQRFAADRWIARHHARRVPLEEADLVVEILAVELLVHRDALPSSRGRGHRRQAVVVTRNAGGLVAERRRRGQQLRHALRQRDPRIGDAAWRRRSDRVAARAAASHRAVLLEHLDLRAVALVNRPVERRFALRHPGVRIGAVVEQQP